VLARVREQNIWRRHAAKSLKLIVITRLTHEYSDKIDLNQIGLSPPIWLNPKRQANFRAIVGYSVPNVERDTH
jgi:hypothetical protein